MGTDLGCSGLDAVLRRNERRKIKTEGRLLAFAASARKSFPVGRVPPRNEANCNKPREMTAKTKFRHAVRPDGELAIRRKDDNGRILGVQRQSRLRVEREQGVQTVRVPSGRPKAAFASVSVR